MSEGPRDGGVGHRARANSEAEGSVKVPTTVEPRGNATKEQGSQMMRRPEDETTRTSPPRLQTIQTQQQFAATDDLGYGGLQSFTPIEGRTPDARQRHHFGQRPLEPPVTKVTLSELDVPKIIHNPKLRHDINFDPELHFRPNLDGEKGRRKAEKAALFWDTLESQLLHFKQDPVAFYRRYGQSNDWCLPKLLRAIKDIIQTLVPVRDREFLDEGLSVELLMQQFYKGIADLEKMASWIRQVLKLHCAPMRDSWVDKTYDELRDSNKNSDMQGIVSGLRNLLSLLEAMKLDVANHQIRCLRSVLIEDTVHFEQRFFLRKIQGHKLKKIPEAKAWYAKAAIAAGARESKAFGETSVFFHALAELVMPAAPADFLPETFVFDEERISKLRADVHDSINLEVCMRLYEDLERMSRVKLAPSIDEEMSGTENFYAAPDSRPSSIALSASGSDSSSPRSSWCIVPNAADDSAKSRAKARTVYNSLLALLQTTPSTGSSQVRWNELLEPIAYQLFRYVDVPQDIFPSFQGRLASALNAESNDELFRRVEEQFHARLLIQLEKRVKEFKGQSGSSLFSLAAGGRMSNATRLWEATAQNGEHADLHDLSGGHPRDLREDGGVDDMSIRLAHLGILHWRVWAPLLYLGDSETDMTDVP
jgi:hypothetical protein